MGYIGVYYDVKRSKWQAKRQSKHSKRLLYNGSHKNEETAAQASDTLARKLMANGEHHKLNFLDDGTQVFPEKTFSSQYIGVCYDVNKSKWVAQRYSRHEKRLLYNGCH